ncbi:MAG: TIGR02757 family protein [Prevotella sp.]
MKPVAIRVPESTAAQLRTYAERYETADFINGDPSWFMHQVEPSADRIALAFLASALSYGSRKQFFPKIQYMLDCSQGRVEEWVRSGAYAADIPDDPSRCYYRLYTCRTMHRFLAAFRDLIQAYGSLTDYVRQSAPDARCLSAVEGITSWFAARGIEGVIPKNTQSSCKRVCMFMRWMVRDGSPVDLGLWSDIIDRRTLIMPMDTHVVQQSMRLGLLSSSSASMSSALRLTSAMSQVFPDDPLKGDFALFGYGVNNK